MSCIKDVLIRWDDMLNFHFRLIANLLLTP